MYLGNPNAHTIAGAVFNRPLIQGLFEGWSLLGVGAKEIAVLAVCFAILPVYPLLVVATGGMTLAEIKGLARRRRPAA